MDGGARRGAVEVAGGRSSHWDWTAVPTVFLRVLRAVYARESLRLYDSDRRSQPLSRNTGAEEGGGGRWEGVSFSGR